MEEICYENISDKTIKRDTKIGIGKNRSKYPYLTVIVRNTERRLEGKHQSLRRQ